MHETAIKEREEIAKVLCATYQLKGYDYSPLEKVKIDEILDKLKDVKKRHDNMIRQMKVSFSTRVSSRSPKLRADSSSSPRSLQIDSKAAEEAIRVRLNALTSAKATQVGERTGLGKQLVSLSLSLLSVLRSPT